MTRHGLDRGLAALTLSFSLFAAAVGAQTLNPPALPTETFQPPAAAAPTDAAPAAKPRPRPAPRPAPVRETSINADDPQPTLTADTIAATALASERYLEIVRAGGWPIVPKGAALQEGSKGPAVATLRRRLAVTGDYQGSGGDTFDGALTAAVKRFQFRHGLRQTGVVAGRTLEEMNVPAQQRFRQLASSAQRIAGSQFPFGPRYVVVNIPSAHVEAVENDRVVRRYAAIVGRPDRASPTVETRITMVNLNPTGRCRQPSSRRTSSRHARRPQRAGAEGCEGLLRRSGNPGLAGRLVERAGAELHLQAGAGPRNALGLVRIDMPNRDAVFMHDTPSRNLFGGDRRFNSSGCVRVQDVRDLAAWILQGTGTDRKAIDAGIATGDRKDIRPRAPIPVAWVYMTGYATPDGVIHFRPDVYGIDKVGGAALRQLGSQS